MKYILLLFIIINSYCYAQNYEVLTQNFDFSTSLLKCSEEKNFFVTYSHSPTLLYWNLEKKELIKRIDIGTPVKRLILKSNSYQAIILLSNNTLIVYDLLKEKTINKLEGCTDEIIYAVVFEEKYAAISKNGAYVWNSNFELIDFKERDASDGMFNYGFLSEKGHFINGNPTTKSYTIEDENGNTIENIPYKKLSYDTRVYVQNNHLVFTENNKKFSVYKTDIYNPSTVTFIDDFKPDYNFSETQYLYNIESKGKFYLSSPTNDNKVVLFNLPDLSVYKEYFLGDNRVATQPISDSKYLVRNNEKNSFELFDLNTLKIYPIAQNKNINLAGGVVFKERYLFLADEEGFVTKWDLKLGLKEFKTKVHKGAITSIHKTDPFRYITVCSNGAIKKWHINKKEPESTFITGNQLSYFSLNPNDKKEGFFISNQTKIKSINLINGQINKYSKYDLRYPNGVSLDNAIGNIDYAIRLYHLTYLEESTFAFTVNANSGVANKVLFATWNGDVKELNNVVFEDNFTVRKIIPIPKEKKIAVVVYDYYEKKDRIEFYDHNGYKIYSSTYQSDTYFTSVFYNSEREKIIIKEASNSVLKEIPIYGKPSNSNIMSEGSPIEILRYENKTILNLREGITQLLDSTNSLSANIYNLSEKDDWLIVDPEGRFDGNENAFELLKVSDGTKSYPLSTYFDFYFTPNLLAKKINSTPLNPIFNFNKEAIPPTVELVNSFEEKSHAKNISIDVRVSSSDSPLSDLRLYHNGKLLKIYSLNKTLDSTLSLELELNSAFGKNNYFYFVSKNDAGLTSTKETFKVKYLGAKDQKPDLYIFAIGIDNYLNPKYNLTYAKADAKAILDKFVNQNSNIYEKINTKFIRDQDANKENILSSLENFKSTMKENDVFVFYYAGHGVTYTTNQNSEFFLVTSEVTKIYGNYKNVNKKAISSEFIKQYSLKINPQKQLYLIDACHSGGALESFASRGQEEEKLLARLARSTGTYWITASNSTETAAEVNDDKHGAFTYTILKAFDDQANLTVRSLCSYVERELPEYTLTKVGKPQYPMAYGFGNDFPLTK